MTKKYTIEVPIYSSPIEHLIGLNRLDDIEIVVYGGVPNSPLNGGRPNFSLDGLFLWNRLFFSLSKNQLAKALAHFYNVLEKANKNGISFRIVFTNMFVEDKELNEENLEPVKRLVESFKKYGTKNGVILNNKRLEDFIRARYGGDLVYVASCTKYVSPDRILSPRETLRMYLEDSRNYDLICLTPQDSRRESLIRDVLRDSKSGTIAISNSYCSNQCNSYYHYVSLSEENKKSLLTTSSLYIIFHALSFVARKAHKCSAFRQLVSQVDVERIAQMQLRAGIVNFKLGRGFGANLIDQLVLLILKHHKNLTRNF